MPRGLRAAALIALAWSATAAVDPGAARLSRIRFDDRASEVGVAIRTTNGDPNPKYIIEVLGSGCALFDYDLDEDLDLYVANGSLLTPMSAGRNPLPALYRNNGQGRFTDVTKGSGLEVPFWGLGAATGDYDSDGDPDLFVSAFGPDHLFRNDGDGSFEDVTREAGLLDDQLGASAAFLDYDGDGHLDLFVANYMRFDASTTPPKGDPAHPCTFRGLMVTCGPLGLPPGSNVLYRNNGDGTFTDANARAGLPTEPEYYALGVVTGDVDGDGLIDILVANDTTPNYFYRNLGAGRFLDDALMAGFALSGDGREQAGMGIDLADLDGDGDQDVYVTNFSHDYSTLRFNDGKGSLEDVTVRMGLVEPTVSSLGWGTLMFDADNDGDLDLFHANGHVYPEVDGADIGTTYIQRNQVFENLGGSVVREVVPAPGSDLEARGLHRGVAGGDLDGDGDIDLVVTVLGGQPRVLFNESDSGSWLMVRLAGRAGNRDGVGARITVRSAGRAWISERRGGRSYLSASDPRVHFGLGGLRDIESIEVRWPGGASQMVLRPGINRTVSIEETTPGTAQKPMTAK